MASDRPISVAIASSIFASRCLAISAQASRRCSLGTSTLLMPYSVTPRRMNGITVVGKSPPCARPQAATAP